MDDRLARIRARTGGPFTLAMARAAEVSDAERRRSLRRAEWLVLRRGVYVEAALVAEADLGQRHALQVAGLRLVVDFDAVAAGPSAARIWGLETLSAPSPELVVVTQDAGVAARRRGDCLVRVSELPPQHRTVRHGVPVISPARTAIDLARGGSFEESVVVVDSLLRSGAVSLADLDQVLLDCYWLGGDRAGVPGGGVRRSEVGVGAGVAVPCGDAPARCARTSDPGGHQRRPGPVRAGGPSLGGRRRDRRGGRHGEVRAGRQADDPGNRPGREAS